MISSAKLSAFAIRQLGESRGVSTAAIEAKSIEDIRALQALSVVAMSNASGSSLLKGNAASLVHGFRVNRSQEPVEELHGFSHLGFDITKPEKKKPTGG